MSRPGKKFGKSRRSLFRLGRSHDFMMSGILASAALHLFVIVPFLTIWEEDSIHDVEVFSVSIVSGEGADTRARVAAERFKELEKQVMSNSGDLAVKAEEETTPTPTPTPTVRPTKVPPTAAPTAVPTATIAPTATPTKVPTATSTPKPKPTNTPRATSTRRPKPTKRPKAIATAKPKPTKRPKKTPTVSKADKGVTQDSKRLQAESMGDEYTRNIEKYLGDEASGEYVAGQDSFGSQGGPGGGGSVRPRSYFTYMRSIQRELRSAWTWHTRRTNLKAEIEMRVGRDGTIIFAQIAKSSGNREFDKSVMRAIRAVDPFPPPPSEVYDYFKHVILVFDPAA